MVKNDDPDEPKNVTALLRAWSRGQEGALESLLPLVYEDLRVRAARYLRRERSGHTLQPTALVHEAFLRLFEEKRVEWRSRGQFFGVAAVIMRRILVDHARSHRSAKRGGTWCRVPLDDAAAATEPREVDLLDLDEALAELTTLDARQARIVELRFFAGLSIEESAMALELSAATVKRDWDLARAWLYRRIKRARS